MPVFIPLENNNELDRIEISQFDLQELKSIITMALDNNPSDEKFSEYMQKATQFISQNTLDAWLTYLRTIKTEGERPNCICFVLEDWIDTWRIADFIELVWPIARIEYVSELKDEQKL